jgi:hypothetical protein
MGRLAKASGGYSFAWGGSNCQLDSTYCNNTREGVFAVYGGLCVSDATTECPDVADGTINANTYSAGGIVGITRNITVANATSTCNIEVIGGIITGTTC